MLRHRLSQYCDIVHLPPAPERENLVLLHSYRTGAELLVEEKSLDSLIQYFESNPEQLSWATDNKIVVDQAEDELHAVLSENKHAEQNCEELYRVIMPTAQCGLGCTYCGQLHSPMKLDFTAAASILSEIDHTLATKRYKYFKVGWFGAEPLQNYSAIRRLTRQFMETAAKYDVRYGAKMTTNGLKLNADVASELIHELHVTRLDVTLDGPAPVHDTRRPSKGGKGTFQTILANLNSVVSMRPPPGVITIRCNVDRSNVESIEELILIIADQGWGDAISLYFAPVHAWGDYQSSGNDSSWLAEKEIEWRFLARHFGIPVSALPTRKYITCMATNEHARLYDPGGKTYPCTELPLTGSATHEGTVDYDFRAFNSIVELREVPCWQCKMLPVCGGACPKQWADGKVPCPLFKFNAHQLLLQELAGVKKNERVTFHN